MVKKKFVFDCNVLLTSSHAYFRRNLEFSSLRRAKYKNVRLNSARDERGIDWLPMKRIIQDRGGGGGGGKKDGCKSVKAKGWSAAGGAQADVHGEPVNRAFNEGKLN